jgi:hypothetical protein
MEIEKRFLCCCNEYRDESNLRSAAITVQPKFGRIMFGFILDVDLMSVGYNSFIKF